MSKITADLALDMEVNSTHHQQVLYKISAYIISILSMHMCQFTDMQIQYKAQIY